MHVATKMNPGSLLRLLRAVLDALVQTAQQFAQCQVLIGTPWWALHQLCPQSVLDVLSTSARVHEVLGSVL